jgi:hypothetical protein
VNVMQPLANRRIRQRRWMSFNHSPMPGVGPLLVGIKFLEVGSHWFSAETSIV